MKELQEIVQAKTAEMIESGALEEMIAAQLKATLQDVVKESMRSYGVFGKAIKEKIETSLGVAAGRIEVPEYSAFIASCVDSAFVQVLDENARAHMMSLLEPIIEPAVKEVSSSKIVGEVQEMWGEEAKAENRGHLGIECEESEHAIYVKFTHPLLDSESVHVSLYNHREEPGYYHIGYIAEGERRMTGNVGGTTYGKLNGVASYLFKLWAMRTRIKVDVDDFHDIDMFD